MVIGVAAGLVAGNAVTIAGNATAFAVRPALVRELPSMLALAAIIAAACGAMWGGAEQIAHIFNTWLLP